jgi:hypothetical protein
MDGKRSGYITVSNCDHQHGLQTSSSTRETDEANEEVCGVVWNSTVAGNEDRRRGEEREGGGSLDD